MGDVSSIQNLIFIFKLNNLYNFCRASNNHRTWYIKSFVNDSICTDLTVISNFYFSK